MSIATSFEGRSRVRSPSDTERRRRKRARVLRASAFVALAAAVSALLCGCAELSPTMFRPAGSAADEIRRLAIQIFAILSFVLLTVWVLLAYVIIRFRNRPEELAVQTQGNTAIEVVWTLIPTVIVAVLFALTIRATHELTLSDPGAQFATVGHQWWWEFDFEREGFKTANEVHVPVDRTVSSDLTSPDVIHSFWVPQMGGKVDMIPGRVNHIRFVPLTEGSYIGECAEFCGANHGTMRFLFVVESPAEFSAWVDHQRLPAATPTSPEAIAGGKLITTIACGGCHTIRGTTMRGAFGPDLTHFGSRTGIAALTLPNTPANLAKWLEDPQAVKPQCHMPRVPLPPAQIAALVAYLEELR
jgi:cytochrome c oxidase subunit II